METNKVRLDGILKNDAIDFVFNNDLHQKGRQDDIIISYENINKAFDLVIGKTVDYVLENHEYFQRPKSPSELNKQSYIGGFTKDGIWFMIDADGEITKLDE